MKQIYLLSSAWYSAALLMISITTQTNSAEGIASLDRTGVEVS